MLFKIISKRFKNQKLISMFILLSAVVTSFVICFAYGIYQNYKTELESGEIQSKTIGIDSLYSTADVNQGDLYEGADMTEDFGSITKGDLLKCLNEISEETMQKVDYIYCDATIPNEVYEASIFDFLFKYTEDGIISAGSQSEEFTDE